MMDSDIGDVVEQRDWASEEGIEELKKIHARWEEAKKSADPPLPNLESEQRRQEILSEHHGKKAAATVDYINASLEAVPQLIEALDEAQQFANGFNGEMIGIIRSITDEAGADAVPFLDDAVRRVVLERDQTLEEVRRLEVFGTYAGVPMLLQRPLHFDDDQWHDFKKKFWEVIAAGADAKTGRLPKDSVRGEVKSAMWKYGKKKEWPGATGGADKGRDCEEEGSDDR